MSENRVSGYSQPKTAPMSPPYAYTAIADYPAEDEEDFCVVCEGECTCGSGSSNRLSASRAYSPPPIAAAPPSPPPVLLPSPVVAPRPTLKIKFSAKLLSKARGNNHTSSSRDHASASSSLLASKKLSRPSKSPAVSRNVKSALIASGPKRLPPKPKPRPRITKNTTKQLPSVSNFKKFKKANKIAAAASPWAVASSSSELTDLDDMMLDEDELSDDGRAPTRRFPTFVEASAIDSASASDSSEDLSGFDSDSSMEAEEENFIIADERRQKERVRRELLGDDATQRTRAHNSDWEIKPRMRSVDVGGTDDDTGDNDNGSDAESEDDEEGADVDGDDDDDDDDDEDDDEDVDGDDSDHRRGARFVSVTTGWSDDEGSGPDDAELFFANLVSSHNEDSSTTDSDDDMEPVEIASSAELANPHAARPPQAGGLQVTHGWDGEVVFTNGFMVGTSFTDADLAYLFASDSASDAPDTDAPMRASPDASDGDGDGADTLDDGSGETTEEELVDAAGLPTPRAMALFRPPTAVAVSAVNPLSTLSPAVRRPAPPAPAPGGGEREPAGPEDVLAGRFAFDNDSDEHDHDGLVGRRSRSASWASSSRGPARLPRMGVFHPEGERPAKSAVIDGMHNDVPSPFQQRRLSRASARSRAKSILSSVDSPLIPSGMSLSDNLSSFAVPADEFAVLTDSGVDAIDIDDVLHPSILLAEPDDSQDPSTTTGDESSVPGPPSSTFTDLDRWDIVPVNAFRQTRAGLGALDSPAGAWGGDASRAGMIKESPFSQMLWPNAASDGSPTKPAAARRRRAQSAAAAMGGAALSTSPVMLTPIRAEHRGGDREATPTPGTGVPALPPQKSRKELRREKRLARKANLPQHINNNHHHHAHQQRHQHHQHHPNGKSRASGSLQRSNFFSSPSLSVGPSFSL